MFPYRSDSGLPHSDYQHGMKLLVGHRKIRDRTRSLQTALNRFQRYFLPNLRTARTPSLRTHGDQSLPGIGNEFWKHARAHIYRGTLPPVVPDAVFCYADQRYSTKTTEMAQQIRQQFPAGPFQFGTPKWGDARVIATDGNLILRVPIHEEFTMFQDKHPVIDMPERKYHGTHMVNVISILQNGLMCSNLAHKVVGLWVSGNLEYALQWHGSCIDYAPGLASRYRCP